VDVLVTTLEESVHELGVQETHLVVHSTMSRKERRLLLSVLMKLSSAFKQNSCKAPANSCSPFDYRPAGTFIAMRPSACLSAETHKGTDTLGPKCES
jgi:hypothetical protein